MKQHQHKTSLARNRLSLILVLAVALVPIGLSYLLYYLYQGNKPWGMTNHGELLDPVINIADLRLQALEADPSATPDTHSNLPVKPWRLMLLTERDCDTACLDALRKMKAMQILLGKDADRVRPLLVWVRSAATQTTPSLAVSYPALTLKTTQATSLKNGLYIVDPLGNVILRYPYSDVGSPVLTDLKKLLKVSQIG